MIALYNRVIVTKQIPEEKLFPGDVGTVVEEYRDGRARSSDMNWNYSQPMGIR